MVKGARSDGHQGEPLGVFLERPKRGGACATSSPSLAAPLLRNVPSAIIGLVLNLVHCAWFPPCISPSTANMVVFVK